MAAVPGIRPPKLSPFWGGFYTCSFISNIFGKSPFAVGRGGGQDSGPRFLVHTGTVHGGFAVLLRTSCYEFVVEWTCAV